MPLGSSRLNARIFRPYAVLWIVAAAIIGLFVLLRVVVDGLENRLGARLADASQQAQLEIDSLTSAHAALLEWIVLDGAAYVREADLDPVLAHLMYNPTASGIDRVVLLDQDRQLLLALDAMTTLPGGRIIGYSQLDSLPSADLSLASFSRETGSAGVLSALVGSADTQPYLVTARALPGGGTALTATTLERLSTRVSEASGVDLVIYNGPGYAVASTLPGWGVEDLRGTFTVDAWTYFGVLAAPARSNANGTLPLELNGREYRVRYVPLVAQGRTVGLLGLIVPVRYAVALALTASDTPLFLAFAFAASLVVLGGVYITVNLLRPVVTALSEEYAKSSAILTSIADGVIVRGADGSIVLANEAAQTLLSVGHAFDPSPLDAFAALCPDGECAEIEVSIGSRVISVSGAPLRSPEGGASGTVLILRDVTARVLTERTKDSFLSQIGHELRTPLTGILGFADALTRGGERLNPEMRDRAVSAIAEQSNLLAEMIDRIIDLAAVESGGLSLRLDELDLAELAGELLADWRGQLLDGGLAAHFSAEPPSIPLRGDRRRLRTALDQLLNNALRFSPDGGDLFVSVTAGESFATLRVQDSGVGISADDLPHVFERFFRGEPLDRQGNPVDVRGVGQGLYLVRAIVQAHGGTVSVESQPGVGSTFTLRLPLVGPSAP